MKLIDKDTVVAKIKKRFDEYSNSILRHYDACTEAKASELGKILVILDTIKVKEGDINKEISYSIDESIVRKIIDLYFEASKHYDEVIKQERYRTGGSQLAIDILSGSKDMKELCVQYILDKVNKE